MDVQFIDITSFMGVSSNAEHYYAKVGKPEYTQEHYLFDLGCKPESGVLFNGRNLRYYPSEEEAVALYKKDNWGKPVDMDCVMELQEEGTIRFPSILSIVKAAKKEFPNSVLCFSISGSRKMFTKYLQSLKGIAEEITKILEVK